MDTIRESFIWQGLTIETLHTPEWSESHRRICGHALAHLEITSAGRAPLPISQTGYRSHFTDAGDIEAAGGAVAYVRAWLDHAGLSPEWIAARQQTQQLSLF